MCHHRVTNPASGVHECFKHRAEFEISNLRLSLLSKSSFQPAHLTIDGREKSKTTFNLNKQLNQS